MAQTSSNIITRGLKGQVGKQLVFKQYGKKTVVTRYPDMSRVKPSTAQKEKRKGFAAAVAYARRITNDPVLKALYQQKVKKGQRVYNYAIQEFFKLHDA
ncbi:MAG: hypothetical protein KGZ74_01775 [Chitinophagaceae bacterium]|nr:hypothetical protein [Chitinophagaceae bacterium]